MSESITEGTLWHGVAGKPISTDLLGWPPDLFALTTVVLERSEVFRLALSPPAGRQWPPGSPGQWAAAVEAAGRQWSGAIDDPANPLPQLLTDELDVVIASEKTWLEKIADDWRLCEALLTLHAVADEACAGLGVAVSASNPVGCGYRGRARELLARRGTLARLPAHAIRVLPKVRTPATPGTSIRAFSRYATAHQPGVAVQWHRLPARRRGVEPRADHVNFLLLPWPLRVRSSDFRAVAGSVQRDTEEPYGFFDFDPGERLDLDLVDRMLAAARDEVDNVDVVFMPESAITEAEVAPLEALLESHGVTSLTTGVRQPRSAPDQFPGNWVHIGLSPQLEKGRSHPSRESDTAWFHVRQHKHHRWSLDTQQIYQYHLGGELHPQVRWWEGVDVPNRLIHFIEFGEGLTTVILVCEDLAQNDDVADLIRSVGPTIIATPLLDGPQLASRWAARYASVMADDPGSAVLTLTSWGLVERCRPDGREAANVVGLWKDPSHGVHEIPLEPGAQGILLAACSSPAARRSNDGRRAVRNAVDFYDVSLHQIRPATHSSPSCTTARKLSTPTPLDVDELTILCGWAEAAAEALAFAPQRLAAVLADAATRSPWRAQLGLPEPSPAVCQAIDVIAELTAGTSVESDPLGAALKAAATPSSDERALTTLVRQVLIATLELRDVQRRRDADGGAA